MNMSLKEQTRLRKRYGAWAIVTGATSGIGLELAKQLAMAGCNLIINARNQERLDNTAQQFIKRYGIQVRAVAADLSAPEGVDAIIHATRDVEVGLLVNNAGFGTSGRFVDSEFANEVSLLRTNCEAVLRLTHHYAPRFAAQGRGGIIFLSSIVAFQGVPYAANYAASKAYIQSLAEGLAHELKPYGVDVLAVAPGPVESGFGDRANMQMGKGLQPSDVGVPILHALGRSSSVLPGLLSKVLIYALRTVPRWGKVRIMQIIMGGFTQHQRVVAK